MTGDNSKKQGIPSKRHRRSSIGGRAAQFIGAGHHFTLEQIRAATQKSVSVRQRKREQSTLPGGTLRQWHWRAIVVAWKARPEGVKASSGWRGDYGNISRKVWLRLRDYEDGALIETYQTQRERRAGIYTPQIYWLCLTPFGEQFYRDNWQRYRELYPQVDAPAPTSIERERD